MQAEDQDAAAAAAAVGDEGRGYSAMSCSHRINHCLVGI